MTTVGEVLAGGQPDRGALASRMQEAGAVAGAALKVVPVRDIADALWEAIDLPLGDLVFGAWDRHELVERAKASTRGKMGAVEKVAIKSHTIRSAHHPKIEFDMAGASLPAMSFDLNIELKLDGAVVTVRDGAIREIVPGTGSADASLAIGDKKLLQRQAARLTLPPVTPRQQ